MPKYQYKMGWIGRKRDFGQEEIKVIENVENRFVNLMREWNASYKGTYLVYEALIDRSKKWYDKIAHPAPPFRIDCREKKIYEKHWKKLMKLHKDIPKLVSKGDYMRGLGKLLEEIDSFQNEVFRLQKDEIKRFDGREKVLREYLSGKTVDQLTLPANKYDRQRSQFLYRWHDYDSNEGIAEARELLTNGQKLKNIRIAFTKRLLEVLACLRKDILSLS